MCKHIPFLLYTKSRRATPKTGLTIADYYDENGNIQELETVQEITWNYRDNISSAVLLKRENETDDAEYYVYDATGQRVRKVYEQYVNAFTTRYTEKIYLGGVEIKRVWTKGFLGVITTTLRRSTHQVMDDARRIATVHNWSIDTNLSEINSSSELNINKIRYQYGNHLDSASLELSITAQIISYEEYFPYGDTSFIAGTSQKELKLKEYRYTGKEKDDATGLYYYGARYYASWLGRWMSADPLFRGNPGVYERPKGKDEDEKKKLDEEYFQKLYSEGLNLYGYVNGNPVRFNDPDGYEMFEPQSKKENAYWIVRDGDKDLKNIVNQLNKEYNMDITLQDIKDSNPQIKNLDKIRSGDKIDLSFLKFGKTYTLGGGDLEVSLYAGYGGGYNPRGIVQIVENKTVTNINSDRTVHIKKMREIIYNGYEMGAGASFNFTKGFTGMTYNGTFKNLDDAENTFLGFSEVDVALLLSFTKTGASQESGCRWYITGYGFSKGVIKFNKSVLPGNVGKSNSNRIVSREDSVTKWLMITGNRKNDKAIYPNGWYSPLKHNY